MGKKICLFAVICFSTIDIGFSQSNTFPSSGNVGIGTTSPATELHVKGNDQLLVLQSTYSSRPNANVGIKMFAAATDATTYIDFNPGHPTINMSQYEGRIQYWGDIGLGKSHSMEFHTQGVLRMRIDQSGNVGIGTTDITERLTVNGTVRSEEVIVTEDVGADFVFEENYPLPELSEIKEYIDRHKHLPDIPSAEEMKRNGIKVGDLQMKLLQKIEELTLYSINLQKQLNDTKNSNSLLIKRVNQLETTIKKILGEMK